ncbi:unnamed protein product [Camellia sinensis]
MQSVMDDGTILIRTVGIMSTFICNIEPNNKGCEVRKNIHRLISSTPCILSCYMAQFLLNSDMWIFHK